MKRLCAALFLCACVDRAPDDTRFVPTPVFPPANDPRAGLDAGQPLDDAGGVHFEAPRVREAGAGWIRINFRLGPYASPSNADWQAAYDEIVDAALAEGLQIYGLIGAEAVSSANPVGSAAWLDDYAASFVAIVDRYKDRVRVYESFNEPNNWIAPDTPALTPEQYAALLQRVYLETKYNAGHADDPAWQVTIVSGALFSFDDQNATAYLDATYAYGRSTLAWDYTCAETGSFPLDGIGYHIYVREDPDATAEEVNAALTANLDAILATAASHESACPGGEKRAWLSEIGWNADYTGEDIQARNVQVLFDTFRADDRVALYTWFTLQDFPGGPYGLFRLDGTPRPSYDAFRSAALAP